MTQCPRFNVIIATDKNGGFSYKNKLPWKFIKDSNFYNIITSSNVIFESNILIMGRKTWESMRCSVPKNRIAFVITTNFEKYMDNKDNHVGIGKNLFFFPSFSSALDEAYNFKSSIVWVVGGYEIYNEALNHDHCASIYLTEINGNFDTDRKIDLSSYNINWTNVHTEVDVNCFDKLNYILYFKKGLIVRH